MLRLISLSFIVLVFSTPTKILAAAGCPGDFNSDGVIDFKDLLIVAQNYGKNVAAFTNGDLDGNGIVDKADLNLLSSHYGHSCPNTPLPSSMGALGDSITAGLFANAPLGRTQLNDRELNFATGTGTGAPMDSSPVQSHLQRLNALKKSSNAVPAFGGVNNLTSPYIGARAADVLATEIPEMFSWSQTNLNQSAPDYLTLFVGANDLCGRSAADMTSEADFQSVYSSALAELVAAKPNIRILAIPLPPSLLDLNSIAANYELNNQLYCQSIWNSFHECPNLTNPSDSDKPAIAERLAAFNQAIETAAQAYPKNVRTSEGVYNLNFSTSDLALDCFHPSYNGQKKLAATTWADSFWNY